MINYLQVELGMKMGAPIQQSFWDTDHWPLPLAAKTLQSFQGLQLNGQG